ncbi:MULTISPECIES: PBECR2 nuclease fold domain-containing protein [unclassified Gemella]|uniref:PBECR3 domain-containing polyvalent protein n=1 Tax=unclassified Gemella TaxID=2624949 RepID=UPI0010749E28|nr:MULTISPECIES: PBECR2 nuclease fold domain-containing protein [unclassified Gemella]MBF0709715.1 hypothetical protein [Gemella sp. GL1.1]MBF0747232.1 hypothetical protein [Gemella sp. 19428wG2_WT2a]NYS27059.1 hypothetical protein [Gemella sp. GL1]TFU57821.1 hypothetical protein E4T67_06145 [Gemella sp. WT2a]
MKVNKEVKKLLNIKTDVEKIIISNGLKSHMIKHNHSNVLSYIDNIKEIIKNPDFVGVNRRIKGTSVEYLKLLDDNILVAVKLDSKNNYFYTASMYEVKTAKLEHMIKTGRLKKY